MFFGSVTQAVIRKSHFPVLAIPEKYTFKPLKEVLYMSDLDSDDTISIAKLLNLFGSTSFHLHITHFNLDGEVKDEALYAIGDKIRTDHKEAQVTFEVVDARVLRDAYKQYIAMKQIDIIALTTRKDHGMVRFLNPGTAVDVLYHGKLPVLIFHKP
jgi:nucleotide-binding universal stress UspA family protein